MAANSTMRREEPADAELSACFGFASKKSDAGFDAGPAALLSGRGRSIGCWSGGGGRVVQHRRIGYINERRVEAQPLPSGECNVMRYPDLRIPCPKIT